MTGRVHGRAWGGTLALLLCLPSWGAGQARAGEEQARPDTVRVDSTRARVLEALERVSRPPVSRQLIVDGDSAFMAGVTDALARRQRQPPRTGAASMSSDADSVMAALLGLTGYEPARYQGDFAEFETAEGRLTLLSRAGLDARRAAGGVTDSLVFGPDSLGVPIDSVGIDPRPVNPDTLAPTVTITPLPVTDPDSGGVTVPDPAGDTVQPALPGAQADDAPPPVRLFFEGREIQADTAIRYFERTGRINTVGRTVTIDGSADPLESRNLIYSTEEGRGTALGARTRYAEGAGEWFVYGDANSIRPGEAWLHDAMFTSCDLETPHSHFSVDEIKIINGRVLVARPVVLYFADVPVAWLPFIAQGLGTGRTSGLLTPTFSVNDIVRASGGYSRRISNVGFYWAMSEYTDASLAMDWFSNNFTSLTGTMQYNWARRFLSGNVAYRQYWRQEGQRELAFDTGHNWQFDERTTFRMSARYSSSAEFVRQNSFDPREATQSINSDGGLNRRFDWGNLSATANRRQYLTDNRVEMTLPSVNLSLTPITFFQALPGQERFYNNITWTGSSNYRRSIFDVEPDPDRAFSPSQWDRTTTTAGVSSSLSFGGFSWSQSADFNENLLRDAPVFGPGERDDIPADSLPIVGFQNRGQADVNWSTSLSYSQRLIGTTQLSPSVSLSGRLLRADTIPAAASGYVSAPRRVTFGATLNSDLYAFFPGLGGFDAFRHKVSPSVSYSYAPAVVSSALQEQVFGAFESKAQNRITFGFNQTFEARRPPREDDDPADPTEPFDATLDPDLDPAFNPLADPDAPLPGEAQPMTSTASTDPNAPTRRPQAETVKLLGLNTSTITYDFVLADSVGNLRGITSTQLSNTITSDFLRGLSINVSHDLFDDREVRTGGPPPLGAPGRDVSRRFDPYLSRVSMGFSLGSTSGIFRRLGLFQGGGDGQASTEPQLRQPGLGDESAIVPGLGSRPGAMNQQNRFTGSTGAWNANFNYTLQRSRVTEQEDQMLQANLNFRPTPNWDVSWQTAYNLAEGGFNDHFISLGRDLHEWRATFDFVQTVTGNWSFRFNVALVANPDLKFDFEQRSQIPDTDPFFR